MTTGTGQEKHMIKTALDIALEVIEAENNHDVDALVELNSTDFKWHLASGEVKTRDELRKIAEGFSLPTQTDTSQSTTQCKTATRRLFVGRPSATPLQTEPSISNLPSRFS